jgi:hypothetical protein
VFDDQVIGHAIKALRERLRCTINHTIMPQPTIPYLRQLHR